MYSKIKIIALEDFNAPTNAGVRSILLFWSAELLNAINLTANTHPHLNWIVWLAGGLLTFVSLLNQSILLWKNAHRWRIVITMMALFVKTKPSISRFRNRIKRKI